MESLRSFTVTVDMQTNKIGETARFELDDDLPTIADVMARATEWATDLFESDSPRVGDRIETVEQLAALPEQAVIVAAEPTNGFREVYQVWSSDGPDRYYGMARQDQTWLAEDVLRDAPVYLVAFLPEP
jgi:hypothetical protein